MDVRRLTGGNEHTCGPSVRAGFCWGFNDVGRLGDGTNLDSNVPSRVAGNLSFRTIDTSAEALISCGATL
ncbi:MAG: chromosome condensation regulator RCC1, partial [Gemmatimonadetes bacterium]|nr:chromosome condensation regulator RCC1 [Gemmatimonadota bacterium]NIR42122.1 chromosome condensation regulator RCC1 [Actinomycetota bacterium]NIS37283.1 chromosome condensation regulator RCC1 [Actinomycetota bacterium]NIU71724.1 chromosome condensation regulator RCC1 [Actinomycetota bacterium]NIV91023.1 chromosome condensation regulator RCC1 [Actinomycetota bacterium]